MMKWAIHYNLDNKVFNFDKKGGLTKWTIAHHSALNGSLKMILEVSNVLKYSLKY